MLESCSGSTPSTGSCGPMTKSERIKRVAAGHVCLAVFHILISGVVHSLRQVAGVNPNFDSDLGAGLTEKERQLVLRLATHINGEADIIRQLGLRFLDR